MPNASLSRARPSARSGESTLERLLEDSRAFSAEFPLFLANHQPMMLVALERLGASDERLEEWFEIYRDVSRLVPQPPAVAHIGRADWRSFLGDRSRERDYRDFFTGEVARLGIGPAVAACMPTLTPGIAGSALHSFMRLSYGVMRNDPAEVGAALGYWSAVYLELCLTSGAMPVTDDPGEVLLSMKPVQAYRHVEPELDLLWHFMREVAKKHEFHNVVDQLRVGPHSLRRVADASLALYAATMDFCALHALTGSHWLRILWPVLPDPDMMLRYFWQAIAALYPKIGFPDLPSAAQLEEWRHTPTPDWPEIKAAAVACDDEHDISLAFSAFEEWKFSGDPLYRFVAARRVQANRLTETLLANALLPGDRRADIRVADGKIAGIAEVGSTNADLGERIDLAGALVLPGLIDGHIHLDKTLLGLPFQPHRPGESVAERIKAEREMRRSVSLPVEARAMRLIEQVVAYGTVVLRTHVDIDDDVKLNGLHALLKVREAARDLIDIQIVAFPQSGIVTCPEVADLLDNAIRDGADLVGGLDPAGIDNDVNGHLDAVFAIAERHGVGVDIHLHDPGPLGCFELRQIAARTEAAGLQGRAAVSHAFALGDVGDGEFGRTAAALAKAAVAIMTNGPGPVPMPPVKRLVAAGVTVFAGSDNIRDAWSPYGNGDMLERAAIIGYRQGLLADEDVALAFSFATSAAARALSLAGRELRVGSPADLIAVPGQSIPEAVAGHPPRSLVMKSGRVVARDGKVVSRKNA